MIGVDTNVLVRVLIEDDVEQSRRAQSLIDEAAERSEEVFISDIVLSELEWVLEDAYSVPRRRILQANQALVADERFVFQGRERVVEALGLYQKGKADLADYLIGLWGDQIGARTTYTFDRGLRNTKRFTLVQV